MGVRGGGSAEMPHLQITVSISIAGFFFDNLYLVHIDFFKHKFKALLGPFQHKMLKFYGQSLKITICITILKGFLFIFAYN